MWDFLRATAKRSSRGRLSISSVLRSPKTIEAIKGLMMMSINVTGFYFKTNCFYILCNVSNKLSSKLNKTSFRFYLIKNQVCLENVIEIKYIRISHHVNSIFFISLLLLIFKLKAQTVFHHTCAHTHAHTQIHAHTHTHA